MIKEVIQIFYKKFYTFILFVVIIYIYTIAVQADFFFEPLEIFIKDGKQYTVIIKEGINQIVLSPEGDTYLYRETRPGPDAKNNKINEPFRLIKGQNYIIRVAENKLTYLLQVFATGNKEKAEKVCQELLSKGYGNVFVQEENEWYKVRIGSYNSEEEARIIRAKLENDGWDTWLISREVETPSKLILTDFSGEELLAGQEFSIVGEMVINGEKYPGTSRFVLSEEGISILNKVKLNDLLAGLMSSIDTGYPLSDYNYQELLKARAIALRTGLLYLVFEKSIFKENDFFSLTEYKGTSKVTESIREAVNDTEGIILQSNNLLAGIDIKELLREGIKIRDNQEQPCELILKKKYPYYSLEDLKDIREEKLLVNAEIEWGLRYKEFSQLTWWGPRNITLLDLDLTREDLVVKPVLAGQTKRGLADLSKMVTREGALAGVNGGYFGPDGNPLGLIIKEGLVISEPLMNRTALIFTPENEVVISRINWQGLLESKRDGKTLKITGVNRKPGTNEAVIINKFYGEKAPELKEGILELVIDQGVIISINDGSKGGSSLIPPEGFIIQLHGEKIETGLAFQISEPVFYKDIFDPELSTTGIDRALGAGPRLIEDGKIKITSQEEGFQPDIAYGRAPRSAVGITADQHLVVVTVDGRQPELSIGMTLRELAEWMLNYGVVEGMNLDGGYSARMVVRGFTMNNPGQERLVNNGILIFSK
jgi:hypothetical protein